MADYPETGKYGPHQGMFLGEADHAERAMMTAFIDSLKTLKSAVDVILLEYYPEGQTPHLKWADGIEADLEAFKKTFGKGPEIAQQVYRLWAMAYYHGIDIRGIEQPTPKGKEAGFAYLSWRMSDECNQAFFNCVSKYATEKEKESVRFCMYGGLVHWVKIRKIAPSLIGYRFQEGGFQQI